MEQETALWNWFLFGGSVPTLRAKTLLQQWHASGFALRDVLGKLPAGAASLGLTAEEARSLQPPASLSALSALRWDEPEYPTGLQRLPLKLKPALLFYQGEKQVLLHPIIYFPPAPIQEEEEETVREALSLVLGEALLPAAVQGSEQAALLLEEMEITEGEALLFVRSGLDQREATTQELLLLEQHRLLLLSPLPAGTPLNPKWDPMLSQVEEAAATCSVSTAAAMPPAAIPGTPTLWITAALPSPSMPADVHIIQDAMELITWLLNHENSRPLTPEEDAEADPEVLPSLSPEETLHILEHGGHIPDILRKKLAQK